MADPAGDEVPLALDEVECVGLGNDKVMVLLRGSWVGAVPGATGRTVLTVELDGRRHRFSALPHTQTRTGGDRWGASFALPAWLAPRLDGHMRLSVDGLQVPVPPLPAGSVSGISAAPSPGPGEPNRGTERAGPEPPSPESSWRQLEELAAQPDPALSSHGSASSSATLRAELAKQVSAQTRLQAELAAARKELELSAQARVQLDGVLDELRQELLGLRGLAEREGALRAEVESRAMVLAAELLDTQQQVQELASVAAERDAVLRAELEALQGSAAVAVAARDAAAAEVSGMREEVQRLGEELALARRQLSGQDEGVGAAQALLEEARALSAELRAG